MIVRGSVRRKSKEVFQKVISLRKLGYSYSEIRKETGIAKTTINNWLTFAGLTLTKEHLKIQERKRLENHELGTMAAKITRQNRKEKDILRFINEQKKYFNEPFYLGGILLYEAEGSKSNPCSFSNSDYRLIVYYLNFLEKYFGLKRTESIGFRLYIHDSRKNDLNKIVSYWAKKIGINKESIKISWKHNKVKTRRINPDYVGQFEVRVKGVSYFTRKILAISDIILKKYIRMK